MVIFSIGLLASPQAFADATVTNAAGSSTPGCEDTDSCFIPNPVTISVGETVTWENTDTAAHTVTSGGGDDAPSPDGVFDSSLMMANGPSFSYTFEEAGTYDYHCMVHPWMQGIVIVGGSASEPADTVPPQVLVPDDIVLQTEIQNDEFLITFNPQAIDNIDELITPTCNPASGSVFAIGTTEVVCTATDSSGNTGSNSFNVIIEYIGSLIPDWVKDVAGFWYDGSINDTSFLEAISYLIQNNIIIVPTTESGSGGGEVPDWVKNTAGWWANDEIDDDTFVNAITYLIQQGLIQV